METLAELIIAGFGLVGSVTYMRHKQRRHYDHYRRTYLANFPREMPHDAVLNFIRALSGLPTPKLLRPVHTVVLDVYADVTGIKHYLSIPGHVVADVESLFRTHITGGSLVKADEDPVTATDWEQVAELGTSSAYVPLRIGSAEAVAATLLSAFSPLKSDQAVLMQWVILPSHHHGIPQSADQAKAKAKLAEPVFLAVGRLASKGEASDTLIRRIYTGLSSTHAYGVKFNKQLVSKKRLRDRIRRRSGVLAFPAALNAMELSVIMGYPFGSPNVPGLPMGRARHLAPDHMIPTQGITIGRSSFPGLEDRRIALPLSRLVQHEWVLGPTGSGKSALLHNQAASIMEAGYGLVVIEPKSDLARDVLNSVPGGRVSDVIWFDPTDVNQPIGLNVLSGADPERTAGHVVHLFKGLYGESWGPRLEQILRYSVLTAALNNLTLYDVKQLLVNPDFRSRVTRATRDTEVRQFWRRLEDGPDNAIDSVVNKLDAFVGFRAIRNIVGQAHGLNMEQVVREGKILLVPLPGAVLGEANAAMLGSLIVDQLWQAIRNRPQDKRIPITLMMDEFQNYLNLSTAMEDTFAEARSYGLGMIVANQHTAQLGTSVLAAVKANARTKIAFGMNYEDAGKVSKDFEPLTPSDLQTLAQYEVAARVMTDDGTAPTATARTLPPPTPTGFARDARETSRRAYGRPVAEVEREMAERHKTADTERKRPTIGRVDE